MKSKKKKKKFNLKGLLLIILAIYLLLMAFYYVFNFHISTIVIHGNDTISDNEIIKVGKLDKASLLKTSSALTEKRIKKIDFVKDVDVKKTITGKIIVDIEEAKVLFYNSSDDKYVLSNTKEIKNDKKYLGVATLNNYVPSDIYKSFIKELANVDYSVINMISEIEYSPDISEDVVIDDARFLLKMNDGNSVYVNVVNMDKLNKYQEAIVSVYEEGLGILYLDSNSSNTLFRTYDKINADEEVLEDANTEVEEGEEDELSQ